MFAHPAFYLSSSKAALSFPVPRGPVAMWHCVAHGSSLAWQDELQAEKSTAVDDANIKRMRIEHRYTKPRLPMPTDDDRITMLAEQATPLIIAF